MGRCLAVWLLITTVALATCATVAEAAGSLASPATWHGSFEDLLVAVASAALVACAGWLWLVTTATVADLVRRRPAPAAPRGLTRRLVLAACGAAVLAGVSAPAMAGSGAGDHSLVGLPMPDRAVADSASHAIAKPAPEPAPAAVRAPAHESIIVRTGDSLWSIASERLGPDAALADIDAAWRELYAANRSAIGADPDLIRPGLDLEPGSNRKARP
ncbi:MAG: LysM domain-containing protein [Nocardioides sp.]|uniref:LysM peptidoglycan-binding domain-containing protein n=1 Tax=Nocardioides sp. TaxID=35761 RepID=UPI003263AC45